MASSELTHQRLQEVLSYDPATGEFVWNVRLSNRAKAGSVAGCATRMGGRVYRQIRIDGVLYSAHQLAWFYVHERWAPLIDHRDLDGSNNRLENLREADNSQNLSNRGPQRNNSTGFKGVTLHTASGLFMARIGVRGRIRHLGYFKTAQEAGDAYAAAAPKVHGEFARVA